MAIFPFVVVTVAVYGVLVSVERYLVHIPKELGQTFSVAIMTTWNRLYDTVEKNAGDLRCGIDVEFFRQNWRQYSG
jgi:hypothetical protein